MSSKSLQLLALAGAGLVGATNSTASDMITLKAYSIEENSVTTSGLSSGGFMAVQMHVAYSNTIQGNAVFAGGPYYCAFGNLMIAEEECMYALMGGPKTDELIEYTNAQSSKGTIDNISNLKDDKVYLFSGSKDTTVKPKVVFALEDYYAEFVTVAAETEYDVAAQHCIPTLNYGETCGIKMSPYIGDCNYDGAGKGFQTLYGSDATKGSSVSSRLYKFDQTEFFTSSEETSLHEWGYIYIPAACETSTCKLHVSYHGCLQDYDNIQDTWAVHAGYNDWAEGSNIIVIYPYVQANAKLGNGNACWDWWGYTGADYVLQSGVQMEFSKKLIDRVMGV